jgi:spore coat protein U-like protein
MVLMGSLGTQVSAQFTMPPPVEPTDPLPPLNHPLPPHTEPVPAAAECHLIVNDFHFQPYTSGESVAQETAMGMTISCTEETRISVSVAASPDSPTFKFRVMRHEGGQDAGLRYELYTDWDRSTVWGDGTNETQPIVIDAGSLTTADVFGTIDPYQNVPEGQYSDMLIVTVEAL